jgi:hypothetical protein
VADDVPFLTDQQVRAALAENGILPHVDSVLLMDSYRNLADSFIRAYLGQPKPAAAIVEPPPAVITHQPALVAKKPAPPTIGDLFA